MLLFCFLDWFSDILMFIPLLRLRHPPRPFLKFLVACTSFSNCNFLDTERSHHAIDDLGCFCTPLYF